MKEYAIINGIDNNHKAIVVALTYESPTDYLSTIEKQLAKKHISGKILFDYLMVNRSVSKRFVELDFNGEKFLLRSAKKTIIERSTQEYIAKFYDRKTNAQAKSRLIENNLSYI